MGRYNSTIQPIKRSIFANTYLTRIMSGHYFQLELLQTCISKHLEHMSQFIYSNAVIYGTNFFRRRLQSTFILVNNFHCYCLFALLKSSYSPSKYMSMVALSSNYYILLIWREKYIPVSLCISLIMSQDEHFIYMFIVYVSFWLYILLAFCWVVAVSNWFLCGSFHNCFL